MPLDRQSSKGPFDPDELVRWAETYGHPEEWAKTAQQLHADVERLQQDRDGWKASAEVYEVSTRKAEAERDRYREALERITALEHGPDTGGTPDYWAALGVAGDIAKEALDG